MTEFATDGFLSDDIANYESEIVARYADKFELAGSINRAAHRMIFSIEIGSTRLPDLLLATLLARQASTFQAFLLLVRKGLMHQSEMLVRNLAESMFLVGAICKNNAFADQYILSEELSRKKSLVRLNNDRVRRGQQPDDQASALIAELETKVRDEKIRRFTTEQIAELAGLSSYYDTVYGLFSLAVHSSSRSLDKALAADSSGKVVAVDYGPTVEGFDLHLDSALSMTLYVLHEMANHFSQDTTEVEKLQRRTVEMVGGPADWPA